MLYFLYMTPYSVLPARCGAQESQRALFIYMLCIVHLTNLISLLFFLFTKVVYVCVCECVCVHVCVHVHTRIRVCVHACVHACMHACAHAHVCVHVHACMQRHIYMLLFKPVMFWMVFPTIYITAHTHTHAKSRYFYSKHKNTSFLLYFRFSCDLEVGQGHQQVWSGKPEYLQSLKAFI